MLFRKTLLSVIFASTVTFVNIDKINDANNLIKYTEIKHEVVQDNENNENSWLFSSLAFLTCGSLCFLIYENNRKRKKQRQQQKKNLNKKFVSENGYDLCVLCKTRTPYETNKNIEYRVGYIPGVGQLCKECKNKLKEKDYSILESNSRYSG